MLWSLAVEKSFGKARDVVNPFPLIIASCHMAAGNYERKWVKCLAPQAPMTNGFSTDTGASRYEEFVTHPRERYNEWGEKTHNK